MKQFTLLFAVTFITIFSLNAQTVVPYLQKNGKYILVDAATMKPLANTTEFDEADELESGFWQLCINGKCALYNKFGKELMKPKKLIFRNKLLGGIFKTFLSNGSDAITGLYGLVDTTGTELMPTKYQHLWDFEEGLIGFATTTGKNGFINQKGKIVIQGITDNVYFFSNGLAKVEAKETYYIDKTGKTILKPSMKDIEEYGDFFDGLASFKSKTTQLRGFINKAGKVVLQPIFQDFSFFNNGIAAVKLNDKYGFIDKKGNFIIANEYNDANDFKNGLSVVKKGNLYGAINLKGSVIIPLKYKDMYEFKNGLLIFNNDDTYDFYNTKGETLFSITIGGDDNVGSINNGYGIISLAKETIFINATGKQFKIANPPNDGVLYKTPNYIQVKYPGGSEFKNYFIATNGKEFKQL
jgi:hypothetical protein